MKIVCDNCATKYQIADEKVSGKAFKIRCKKCGHVIVVGKNDGSAAAPAAGDVPAEAPAAAAEPAAGDSVWHLVIDREQVGPMTAEEVRQKVKAGQVDSETYGWKEGFEDWLKLSAIDDFKELFAGKPSEQATKRVEPAEQPKAAAQPAATPGADLMGGQAASEPVKTAAPTAATLYSENGSDARAQIQAAQAAREAQMAAQAQQQVAASAAVQQAAPAADAGGAMTGARSENSVLFSLNNLSALAGGGGASNANASTPKPGYASGQSEASGLIDIRAMAAQHLGGPMAGANVGKAPDLFGGGDAAPVFAPVAPAVLVPTAPSEGAPKWVWALVAVGGVSIIGLIIFLVVFLSGPTQPQVATGPAAGNTGAGSSAGNSGGPTPSVGTTAGTAPTETKPSKTDSAKTDTVAKSDTPKDSGSSKSDKGSKSDKSSKSDKGSKSAAAPKEAAAPPEKAGPGKAPDEAPPPPKPKAAEKPKAKDDLDSLLDSASSGSGGKPQKAEKKDVPETLDRGTIMSTLKSANFAPCKAEGASGVVNVKLTIGRNGKVSDASGPNDCVVKVVKGVKFPEFSGDPMTLTYPALIR